MNATTGLHIEDTKKLLAILQKLVNSGNTVMVAEHNLDVIKSADWIVDLRPERGSQMDRSWQRDDRNRWRRQQAHLRDNS